MTCDSWLRVAPHWPLLGVMVVLALGQRAVGARCSGRHARTITAFGVVSLAGDTVHEDKRSASGPPIAGLEASALVLAVVTGAGEAAVSVPLLTIALPVGGAWPATTSTRIIVGTRAVRPQPLEVGLAYPRGRSRRARGSGG